MKMKRHIGLIIILILSTLDSISQDTLSFQKSNGRGNVFDLPLNSFDIKLKTKNGKKQTVIPTSYEDSVLTVKVWSYKGDLRKAKRKEMRELYNLYPLKEGMHRDTVLKRVAIIDSLQQEILYSDRQKLHINEIEKLIIYNGNIPEMQPILKITEWSAVGWLIVGIPLFAVFPTVAYGVTWAALGVGIITFSIITENKKLKMKKWEILK